MNKDRVLGVVDDLVSDFLYYNRKSDEELPIGRIDELIADGTVSVDEITERFRATIVKNLRG
jgi:hypothetical protein